MIRLAGRSAEVTSATLELYHLFAREAGWNLEAQLAGPTARVALEGRVAMPALPGPSELVVWYVDAPGVVTVEGEHGTLTASEPRGALRCVSLGDGRVRIHGTLALTWQPLGGGASRPYEIELALDAALVT